MITSVVRDSREAIIPLVLRDAAGKEHPFEALVDTGFNGALALPSDLIAAVGLAWRGRDYAVLADGREMPFNFYTVANANACHRRRQTVPVPLSVVMVMPAIRRAACWFPTNDNGSGSMFSRPQAATLGHATTLMPVNRTRLSARPRARAG